jgi:sulfur carrier protein
MQVIVNGERTEVAATNLRGLIDELDYDGTHVAVAVNTHVVPRARWTATNLETGDEVEIISPRQGG